ncbi:hypothetical protein [Xanthovirga aplysinae]|uniref:hypothetical protein n=1 Tax=Xanthovirga aplysinae TaxID=2529853 RepID=UPI0012BC12C7|nr:hypothetical protein [Xanthovirga aplysinae]MTI29909.1 hypothetical protein [Xanthovirga aplysinae]
MKFPLLPFSSNILGITLFLWGMISVVVFRFFELMYAIAVNPIAFLESLDFAVVFTDSNVVGALKMISFALQLIY